VFDIAADGVPEMAPVLVFKLKPAGNEGVIAKLLAVPETVADIVLIAVPTVKLLLDEVYDTTGAAGKGRATEIVRVAVPEPPLFVAVTVNIVLDKAADGVPVIAPVVVFKLNPAGSDGVIAKLLTAPVTVADIVLIAVPTVKLLFKDA
jgi:hypothetical protein